MRGEGSDGGDVPVLGHEGVLSFARTVHRSSPSLSLNIVPSYTHVSSPYCDLAATTDICDSKNYSVERNILSDLSRRRLAC